MDLTLRHLRVLCVVDEEGSIGRAATRLGISQPALSAQLQRIESHLRYRVFDRRPSGTSATRAGRRVLIEARRVLAAMDDFQHVHGSPGLRSSLHVGGHGPLLLDLIKELGNTGVSERPITARMQKSSRLLEVELERQVIDYAVIREYPAMPVRRADRIGEKELLAAEPLFVGLARASVLATRAELSLHALQKQAWVVDADDDSGENEMWMDACRRAGVIPQISLTGDDNGLARSWVGNGRAVALFEARAAQDHELVVRPLAGDPVHARLSLRWREDDALLPGPAEVFDCLVRVYSRRLLAHDVFAGWWRRHGPRDGPVADAIAEHAMPS